MTKARIHKLIRKWHRYTGVFFGVQFFLWTLGGIFFSWTNIAHIRGDDIRKEEPFLQLTSNTISPSFAMEVLRKNDTVVAIQSIQLVTVLDSSFYQFQFNNGNRTKGRLVNVHTGCIKAVLTGQEAIAVAQSRLKHPGDVKAVAYIQAVGKHHEYRNKPLPAYAITFSGKVNSTVYVSPELGTVQSFRNNQWRIYDVLWMLHTMDFEGRSNFNNWLLRFVSVAGMAAILTGFGLYYVSYKKRKKTDLFNTRKQ